MRRRLIFLSIVLCFFLTGCGKRFRQITDLLGKYIGPGYHERIAQKNAEASAQSSSDTMTEEEKEEEVPIATDVDIAPWAAKDGIMPKDIIGELQVKKSGMEIHQYGGSASVIVKLTEEGDRYLVSEIYMNSSGEKWYCIGRNMWLLVGDMDDIQYSVVKHGAKDEKPAAALPPIGERTNTSLSGIKLL